MNTLAPAVHRTIVGVDVEGFGDRHRTHLDQIAVRDGLYQALDRAFTRAGIDWKRCYCEDRGDGALILIPSEVPKTLLAQGVPVELAAAAADHNLARDQRARIRLRLAMHAGEIHHDRHGVTGTAINTAFRLLEAEPLKQALAGSPGTLAVIASRWFYEEVIRHAPTCAPGSWRRVRVSVKETREDAWICLPDAPYPPEPDADLPPSPEVAVPRQLPAAVAGFAGRAAELEALTGLLEEAAPPGGTVVISAVAGMAGVGKTALAVHWAWQVAGRFPDGQLYVNLRGYDPGAPVTPEEAVGWFLVALGAPAAQIPADAQARYGLYRSVLAGRRVLIVLDNARDAAQVRPLLPGSPGCLVVTSRSALAGLAAAEGAHPLRLGPLAGQEGAQLLAARLGPERLAAEPEAAAGLTAWCGGLPLELPAAERRAGAAGQRAIKRVGVVRHEDDGEITVLAPQVVDQGQRRRLCAWAHHLGRGLQEGTHLGVAVGRAADRVSVDPQRGVVEECAAVHLGHVDLALDPVGERVEGAGQVVPVHTDVERKVVARAGRDAHKRDPVRSRHCGHDRQRPVATGHPERVCAGRHGFTGQRVEVLARGEDDSLDPLFARPLGDPGVCGLTVT